LQLGRAFGWRYARREALGTALKVSRLTASEFRIAVWRLLP